MTIDESTYEKWIGRTESTSDVITLAPLKGLAATLDREQLNFVSGNILPPLWHWLYFLTPAKHSLIAKDGHPKRGNFLPPIPLPRRMWAGSRLEFHQSLRAGQVINRISTIKNITFKKGRSGQLAFVTIRHEIDADSELAMSEEHDIVFRDYPPNNNPQPAQRVTQESAYYKTINPDPVLLFRYSALTFNGHRIHYDRDYVTQEEGYPGLIVHGPLLATLLAGLVTDQFQGKALRQFEFKAMHPVFDLNSFEACGADPDQNGTAKLWIKNHENILCMQATAVII